MHVQYLYLYIYTHLHWCFDVNLHPPWSQIYRIQQDLFFRACDKNYVVLLIELRLTSHESHRLTPVRPLKLMMHGWRMSRKACRRCKWWWKPPVSKGLWLKKHENQWWFKQSLYDRQKGKHMAETAKLWTCRPCTDFLFGRGAWAMRIPQHGDLTGESEFPGAVRWKKSETMRVTRNIYSL